MTRINRASKRTAIAIAAALTASMLAGGGAWAAAGGGGGMSGSWSTPAPSTPREPQKPTETRAYKKAVKLINEGKYEDAIERLNKVLADAPNDPDVLNYLGYTHRKLNKTTEAMDYYNRALEADPKHLGAHEYLGELFLQLGNLDKALEQQSTLETLCNFGCSQLEDLKKAIAAYKAAPPAAPTPGGAPTGS